MKAFNEKKIVNIMRPKTDIVKQIDLKMKFNDTRNTKEDKVKKALLNAISFAIDEYTEQAPNGAEFSPEKIQRDGRDEDIADALNSMYNYIYVYNFNRTPKK